MAKLKVLPSLAIIDGLKGKLDFYLWNGIPIARAWPRSPGHARSLAVEATWPDWTWAAQNWNTISPFVQQAYRDTASPLTMSGRDLFQKSYITDYFRDGQWGDDYEASPYVPKISIMDVTYEQYGTGYIFTVTSNRPCHLYMYYTLQEPWMHPVSRMMRGMVMPLAYRFCFTVFTKNEQEEEGDTFTHTFSKMDWPMCQTRWFLFRGKVDNKWSKSCSPVFKLHRPIIDLGAEIAVTYRPTALGTGVAADGTALRGGAQDFADLVVGAGTGSSDIAATSTCSVISSNIPDKWSIIERGFIHFDTRLLPEDVIIKRAIVRIYGVFKGDDAGWNPGISLVQSYDETPGSISDGNYSDVSTNELASMKYYADFNLLAWNSFPLFDVYLPLIIKGGITRFALREGRYDRGNNEPTWVASKTASFIWYTRDKSKPMAPRLRVFYQEKL